MVLAVMTESYSRYRDDEMFLQEHFGIGKIGKASLIRTALGISILAGRTNVSIPTT